jgi:hypothetical protein
VSPVKYELGFYIPEDDILHSHRREHLKSYIAVTGWTMQWRRNVSPVRYELGFYIPEDDILHSQRSDNHKCLLSIRIRGCCRSLSTVQLITVAMCRRQPVRVTCCSEFAYLSRHCSRSSFICPRINNLDTFHLRPQPKTSAVEVRVTSQLTVSVDSADIAPRRDNVEDVSVQPFTLKKKILPILQYCFHISSITDSMEECAINTNKQ